jgi:membrane protease YdiL (CAAX protease family)
MRKITVWIKHHQVLTFFLLVFAITWPGFFLVYYIFPGNMIVAALTAPIVFSPALAAMLIAGLSQPQPRHPPTKARWVVFLLAWLAATAVGVLYLWHVHEVYDLVLSIILNGVFALFPAWVISSAYARNPGIRRHFFTLIRPRGPARWYLVILLIFPGVQLLDYGLTRLFGGNTYIILDRMDFGAAALFLSLEFLRGFLQTGGINEESGWRGFALPRLQARYPVIVSTVIVWFFWAAWHLPYDFGRGIPLNQILENRILWNLVFAILLSWVYNRTNGSILAPALLHPLINTFGNNLGGGAYSQYIFIGLALFAIVHDKMWKKLPADHPAVNAPEKTSEPLNASVLTQERALARAQVAIARE